MEKTFQIPIIRAYSSVIFGREQFFWFPGCESKQGADGVVNETNSALLTLQEFLFSFLLCGHWDFHIVKGQFDLFFFHIIDIEKM